MANNYGELKAELSDVLFHQRFVARYDRFTRAFETDANARLRVRPMEAVTTLTTVNGEAALPADYLLWRTVLPADRTRYPASSAEMEYVHPAYLPVTNNDVSPYLFTIEGASFKARPVNDAVDAFELHYYQKIPTLTGSDTNSNWLLTAWPNAYLFGLMVEAAADGRNAEMAQLYKARRDEVFEEIKQLYALTTGATSPAVRTAEYY